MRVEVEPLEGTQVKLEIEVPPEKVETALQEAYKTLRGYVSLPGFRKGRVPLSLIKSRFQDHINSEVIREVVFPAYEDALLSKRLVPLDQPTFEPSLDKIIVVENQSIVFTAIVNVKPTISVPKYDEIETDKSPVDVPREDVEDYINKLRAQSATYDPIEEDRVVQETDCVRIDWLCKLDGEEVENEGGIDVDLDLTTSELNADLKSGIIGMKVGEKKSIPVTIDEDHSDPSIMGKEVVYEMDLHAITTKQLPELDDEFAKDLGYENYTQLHGVIWNNLVEEQRLVQQSKQKQEILEQLIEKTDIEIPEDLVQEYVDQTIQNVHKQLNTENRTAEEAGIDLDNLPEEVRTDVIKQTKQNWIFEEIAENENISVSDDELEWEIRRAAEQMNRDAQKYAELLKSSNRFEDFRTQLQHEKIYQFLIEQSSEKKSLIITG
ncbi:trigger factor [Candidatus Poribacteria bacterium]|nr:trigger factor [Candidatus Poribacteria bacterium]